MPEGIREVIGHGKERRVERIDTPYSPDGLEGKFGDIRVFPLQLRSVSGLQNRGQALNVQGDAVYHHQQPWQ